MKREPPEETKGLVFPVTTGMHVGCLDNECCRVSAGLTKREWFAARAPQPPPDQWLLARVQDEFGSDYRQVAWVEVLARPRLQASWAVEWAEAMLEALAGKS